MEVTVKKYFILCGIFFAAQTFAGHSDHRSSDSKCCPVKEEVSKHKTNCCTPCPPGPRGKQGQQGERGRRGPVGPAGATGATGPAGLSSPGFVVPYASGTQVALESLGSLSTLGGILSYGTSSGVGVLGGSISPIDLGVGEFGFTMPRDGVLRSVAATFVLISGTVRVDATIGVRVYVAFAGDVNYNLIFNATQSLSPVIAPGVYVGPTSNGYFSGDNQGIDYALGKGDRVVVVFTVSGSGDSPTEISGYASAGLGIE